MGDIKGDTRSLDCSSYNPYILSDFSYCSRGSKF